METRTLLNLAIYEGNFSRVSQYLSEGADLHYRSAMGSTPLHLSVVHHQLSIMKLLLEAGADVNEKDDGGNTPLHLAAWHSRSDVIQLLLKEGLDPNTRNDRGQTALMIASHWGEANASRKIKVLLDAGADPTLPDRAGLLAEDLSDSEKIKAMIRDRRIELERIDLEKSMQTSNVKSEIRKRI